MNRIIHLIIAAGLIILAGTIVMYSIESKVPNSQIKPILMHCGGVLPQSIL